MTQRSLEQILLADGTRLPLTIAAPESAIRGGIVVEPDARGVTDAVWQLAAGLAGDGWLAVIPHLYHRDGIDELPGEFPGAGETLGTCVERLRVHSLHADTDAALGWLARRGVSADRIGVVGFGLGGTAALLVATQHSLGAAVTIDGIGVVVPVSVAANLPTLVDVAPELRCPWLGIYRRNGAVPEEEVRKLQDAAHSAQVATDLVHCALDTDGAFDTDRSLAPEAWARTLNWFGSHLR
ncbi:MAG: dienelactone hydrolase family protein [Pseudonocardiales bacterium]|nr:dienelactone hydrolase family protein [Pseudonocardiales bacterium]